MAKTESGATLVEFALVFAMLLTVVLGIVGFGHMLYAYHFVSHASKTAARWATVNGHTCNGDGSCNGTNGMNNGPATDTNIQSFVVTLASQGIDSNQITTTVPCGYEGGSTCNGAQVYTPNYCISSNAAFTHVNDPGCTVEVTVGYAFNFRLPLLPAASSTQTNAACGTKVGFCLSSTAEMVIVH